MLPLSKQDIQIIIVDDSRMKKCDTSCGVDWSSAEVLILAHQRIRERFGSRVQLKYLDLSQPIDDALELQARIKDLPLPLLTINGHPRISGQFDIRRLMDAIEAEIEIKP